MTENEEHRSKAHLIRELQAWSANNARKKYLARAAKEAGVSITQIASLMGVQRDTIYSWLKETEGAPEPAKMDAAQKRSAALLRLQGSTYQQIGEMLRVSPHEARRAVLDAAAAMRIDLPGDEIVKDGQ